MWRELTLSWETVRVPIVNIKNLNHLLSSAQSKAHLSTDQPSYARIHNYYYKQILPRQGQGALRFIQIPINPWGLLLGREGSSSGKWSSPCWSHSRTYLCLEKVFRRSGYLHERTVFQLAARPTHFAFLSTIMKMKICSLPPFGSAFVIWLSENICRFWFVCIGREKKKYEVDFYAIRDKGNKYKW